MANRVCAAQHFWQFVLQRGTRTVPCEGTAVGSEGSACRWCQGKATLRVLQRALQGGLSKCAERVGEGHTAPKPHEV